MDCECPLYEESKDGNIKRRSVAMKILLTAINAKYIHSNLAVYSLKHLPEYMKIRWSLRNIRSTIRWMKYLQESIAGSRSFY